MQTCGASAMCDGCSNSSLLCQLHLFKRLSNFFFFYCRPNKIKLNEEHVPFDRRDAVMKDLPSYEYRSTSLQLTYNSYNLHMIPKHTLLAQIRLFFFQKPVWKLGVLFYLKNKPLGIHNSRPSKYRHVFQCYVRTALILFCFLFFFLNCTDQWPRGCVNRIFSAIDWICFQMTEKSEGRPSLLQIVTQGQSTVTLINSHPVQLVACAYELAFSYSCLWSHVHNLVADDWRPLPSIQPAPAALRSPGGKKSAG